MILKEIPSPSIFNTLPFQIPKTIWNLPKGIKSAFVAYQDYKQEQADIKKREDEEIERQRLIDEEFIKEKEAKKEGIRKRKQIYAAKEKTDEELKGFSKLEKHSGSKVNAVRPALQTKVMLSGGLWTDEDLTELVRLVKKYPGGTTDRWDIIADQMNRSVPEITFMAAKMKENGYKLPGHTDSVAENIVQEVKKVIFKDIIFGFENHGVFYFRLKLRRKLQLWHQLRQIGAKSSNKPSKLPLLSILRVLQLIAGKRYRTVFLARLRKSVCCVISIW